LVPGQEKQPGFVEHFLQYDFLFGKWFARQQSNRNKVKYYNIIISRKFKKIIKFNHNNIVHNKEKTKRPSPFWNAFLSSYPVALTALVHFQDGGGVRGRQRYKSRGSFLGDSATKELKRSSPQIPG